MRQTLKIIVLVAISLMSACQRKAQLPTGAVIYETTHQPSEEELVAEELAIYSALLKEDFHGVVLYNKTEGAIDPDEYLLEGMPLLSKETLNAYKAANQQSHTLTLPSESDLNYELFGETERAEIFYGDHEDKWDRFYELYPNSAGHASFSRVGFNASLDQALVYTEIRWCGECGSGDYHLFSKKNGEWKEVASVMAWSI